MPVLRLEMHPGRTLDQKRAFVREVTRVAVETLNCPAESVDVVISEVAREDWAKAGKLVADKDKEKNDMEIKLNTRETGSGKTVTVFIHGWGLNSAVWEETFKKWPASSGRALAFDLRGAGKSAKPETGYSLAEHAKDIMHTIRSLDLKEVNLVGHSMGGALAQLVAIEAPELIKKLVLVNPIPASGVPLPPEAVGFFQSAAGNPEVCRQIFASSMTIKAAPAVMDKLVAESATVSKAAVLEGLDAWRNASFAARLGKITCPTTLLSGDADPYLPTTFLQHAVADQIKGTQIRWINGAGHYPHVESTDSFLGALIESLSGDEQQLLSNSPGADAEPALADAR